MVVHTNSNHEEKNWIADSGANAHITNELDNLQIHQTFSNSDTVAVGNGTDLAIEHTGSTSLHFPYSSFQLNNILHCPQASANLLSIQKFCVDNACYFVLTTAYFFIKDLRTKAILLAGRSENGLYPLRLGRNKLKGVKTFTAFLGICTSPLVWHSRLGHPSFDIVNRVVKKKELLVSSPAFHKTTVCISCQLGKSKKLQFQCSSCISIAPLELIHTDVWISPMASVSGFKYYVIFIDDFYRYSWIYHIHQKSEVLNKFIQFKLLMENQFSTKIKQLQPMEGANISHFIFNLLSFKMGFYIENHILTLHHKMVLQKESSDIS